jgi:hypothetical protein
MCWGWRRALCPSSASQRVTLYQKRYGAGMDLRTGNVVQFAAACVVVGALALIFEDMHIKWSMEFVFALLWLVLVLSLGAISLFYVLIRHGAAARVASLFFLVPPCTALIASCSTKRWGHSRSSEWRSPWLAWRWRAVRRVKEHGVVLGTPGAGPARPAGKTGPHAQTSDSAAGPAAMAQTPPRRALAHIPGDDPAAPTDQDRRSSGLFSDQGTACSTRAK